MNVFARLSILLVFVTGADAYQESEGVVQIGNRLSFRSSVLDEERTLLVSLPRSYPNAAVKYPVIYVLDGSSLFQTAVTASHFLAYNSYIGAMPEAIIVGVVGTNRDRDMPVPQILLQSQGHKNFLRSIVHEIIPFISSRYPVNGLNILVGHSQGGLFATYAGTEMPELFKGIVSLDAPITVVPSVLEDIRKKLTQNRPRKYFSAESLYGWGAEFGALSKQTGIGQTKIDGETHETMPYKGIYDGLRFLFSDHVTGQNELSLKYLQSYYRSLSEAWSCEYAVPLSVLMHQAVPMMLGRSKKNEAVELLTYAELTYGASSATEDAMKKALSITSGPDERVEYYLKLPSPSDEAVRPLKGRWSGSLIVPGGMDAEIVWEIRNTDGRNILTMNVMNSFTIKNDFLQIFPTGEIRWGRKHQSGGVYLSVGRLSRDGQVIEGTEELIGHQRADGEPPFVPNRFRFTRVK